LKSGFYGSLDITKRLLYKVKQGWNIIFKKHYYVSHYLHIKPQPLFLQASLLSWLTAKFYKPGRYLRFSAKLLNKSLDPGP
jgi:hypothetical protein